MEYLEPPVVPPGALQGDTPWGTPVRYAPGIIQGYPLGYPREYHGVARSKIPQDTQGTLQYPGIPWHRVEVPGGFLLHPKNLRPPTLGYL